ncbi:MAG: hypothetical protein IJ562_00020 [Prevotella sp.]|nr:hypothetical protein [Prevotella sp.]MBR1428341.1 hypothetical protein [Prevotella sp.]
MKITKNQYLAAFSIIVLLLAIIRLAFPRIAGERTDRVEDQQELALADDGQDASETNIKPSAETAKLTDNSAKDKEAEYSKQKNSKEEDKEKSKEQAPGNDEPVPEDANSRAGNWNNGESRFFNRDGTPAKHRIFSVARYADAFPDSQQVQIIAANKWGVSPVKNRQDAEARKKELVYMSVSPYYHVDRMYRSIPYLVPRAAVLLNDIGRAFYDSLQLKNIPIHQFIVTSVLRTQDDVVKLRNYNGNATENSCHLYGTTFDISYNRYKTVEPPGEKRRQVRNDSLKFVLSEVLNDMRKSNRCYIKYEVKQGCFHITVR